MKQNQESSRRVRELCELVQAICKENDWPHSIMLLSRGDAPEGQIGIGAFVSQHFDPIDKEFVQAMVSGSFSKVIEPMLSSFTSLIEIEKGEEDVK